MQFDVYQKLQLYKQFYPENAETVTEEELENSIAKITQDGRLWEHYFSHKYQQNKYMF